MFNTSFWIYIAVTLILAGIALSIRKPSFIDIQVMIFVAAVAMSADMILCKQCRLYYYVSTDFRGWYSFWANAVACPAMGLIFIKFIPIKKFNVGLYILTWSAIFTLLEEFILKPFGILNTVNWKTIPWSPIGYALALLAEYMYYRTLKKWENSLRVS